jgi:site-specific DNA recombinase
VQAQQRANDRARQNRSRAAEPSLLAGLIYDERGNRFTPAHAVKNGKRYRYYVSQAAIRNPGSCHRGPVRIPAGEIESLICSKIQAFLGSSHKVIDALALQRGKGAATHSILTTAQHWSKRLASEVNAEASSFMRGMISRAVVHKASVDVLLHKQMLRATLMGNALVPKIPNGHRNNDLLSLRIMAGLKRCGGEVRLVISADSAGEVPDHPVPSLIKAVVRAHDWYQRIVRGELSDIRSIARATCLNERYVSRVLQCAFLAPDIVGSILEGRQPVQMTFNKFRSRLPIDWSAQRQVPGLSAS